VEGLALFLAVVESAAAFLLLAGTGAGVLGFFTEDLGRGVATFLAADLRRGLMALLLLALGVNTFFPAVAAVAGSRWMIDLRLEGVVFFTLLTTDFLRVDFLIEERCVFFAAGVSPLLLPMEERERFPEAEAAAAAAAAPLGVPDVFLAEEEEAGFLLPEEEARGMGSEVVALAEPFQGERKPSTCFGGGGGREGGVRWEGLCVAGNKEACTIMVMMVTPSGPWLRFLKLSACVCVLHELGGKGGGRGGDQQRNGLCMGRPAGG